MSSWLVVRDGSRKGAVLDLGSEPAILGREPGVALHFGPSSDLSVSARHAEISRTDEGWVIRDLGSTNGTWVEGERLGEPRLLRPGDHIRLGRSGPTILFTDRAPSPEEGWPDPVPTTATRIRPARRPGSKRRLAIVGIIVVAALGTAVAAWNLTGAPGSGETTEAGGEPAASPEPTTGITTDSLATVRAPEASEPDSTTRRLRRELEELRARVVGLDRELRQARQESEDLRRALAEAREGGASQSEVAELERRLQEATMALRRQRLAASVDVEAVSQVARAATVQVYVEFEGGEVVAATGLGVEPEGLVMTNGHVLRRDTGAGVRRIGVQYAGERRALPAEVVRVSEGDDLALLRLRDGFEALPAVRRFNRSLDTLQAGAPLVLLGYPLGGTTNQEGSERPAARPLISVGILVGEADGLLELEGYADVGASGSPVLDREGQVVGVILGGRGDGAGERVFAVSSERIVPFLTGRARR